MCGHDHAIGEGVETRVEDVGLTTKMRLITLRMQVVYMISSMRISQFQLVLLKLVKGQTQ